MTGPALHVRQAGPAVTIQDRGRRGTLVFGLATGGAADRLALDEAAALLAVPPDTAALEMAGTGGSFTVQLSAAQLNGQVLNVQQSDAAGNPSLPAQVNGPDGGAPSAPANLLLTLEGARLITSETKANKVRPMKTCKLYSLMLPSPAGQRTRKNL